MGLDVVHAFMAVEAAFGIKVPDDEAARMETVGLLFDYVRANVRDEVASDALAPYAGPLWERYLDALEEQTGVRRDRLRPEAYWVRDLNLD